MTDDIALKVAAFVAQALELEEDAASLAGEVVALKRDANAGISTIELDSSVGPAAFLVYHYALDRANAEGDMGRQLFDADLATLERAATQGTPGPRIVAHAFAGEEAYILATTPAVFRALSGDLESGTDSVDDEPLLPGAETARLRSAAAGELIRLLGEADGQAAIWLRAVEAEGVSPDEGEGMVAFDEAESALALLLLDDRGIRNLLRLINTLLTSARGQAAAAVVQGPDAEPPD